MLRDSKLNFKRLTPIVRAAMIGSVLLGGLLVAGLRGPAGQTQARADEPVGATAAEPAAPAADAARGGEIDLGVVPHTTSFFAAVRPAAVFARPELAWAKSMFRGATVTPMGKRMPGLRQITMLLPTSGIGHPGQDLVVYQSSGPLSVAALLAEDETRFTTEDFNGRKIFRLDDGHEVDLQYDDRTIVQGAFRDFLDDYLASDRGVRPSWLSKKTWEAFREDQAVGAVDARSVPRLLRTSDAPLRSFLPTLGPLWQNATCIVAGIRLEADIVRIHAVAVAEDEKDAELVRQTVDAARVLTANAAQGAVEQNRGPASDREWASFFARALRTVRVTREGCVVQAETSVSLAAIDRLQTVIVAAQQSAERVEASRNLRNLALALVSYESARGHFPPAAVMDPDGKTPHSWRVEILPLLGQQKLYDQYHLNEPWDSPANRKVLAQIPPVFRAPGQRAASTNASYFALTGPGTMFDGPKGIQLRDVRDGCTNTILLVEAKRDIPWTKPEDIPYYPEKPLAKLGGFVDDAFNVVMVDGHVVKLYQGIAEKTLRALITRRGGEVVKLPEATEWPRAGRQPSPGSTAPRAEGRSR